MARFLSVDGEVRTIPIGRLLPTGSDAPTTRSDDATVVFLDEDRADAVIAAAGSGTAREILRALLEEPQTPSELATELGVAVETVSYHLTTLSERELITEDETVYSEKGREMTVYGLPKSPTVLIFGSSANEAQLRAAVSQLASPVGPMAVLIALKQSLSDTFELLDLVRVQPVRSVPNGDREIGGDGRERQGP